MSTQPDFEADKLRCKATTGEEWVVDEVYRVVSFGRHQHCPARAFYAHEEGKPPKLIGVILFGSHEGDEANLDFVLAAKTNWLKALEEIEMLKKVIHDLQQESLAYNAGKEAGYKQGNMEGKIDGYFDGYNAGCLRNKSVPYFGALVPDHIDVKTVQEVLDELYDE